MKARTIIPHLFLEAAPTLIQIANMTDPNFFIESDRLYLCYFQPDDDSSSDSDGGLVMSRRKGSPADRSEQTTPQKSRHDTSLPKNKQTNAPGFAFRSRGRLARMS